RRAVERQEIPVVNNGRIVPELLRRPVIVKKAVPLPFHVVQLGIDVSRKLAVPSQFIGEKLETPARIDISIKCADAAVFAVDQRLRLLLKSRDVIERRAGIGLFYDLFNERARLRVIVTIKMP